MWSIWEGDVHDDDLTNSPCCLTVDKTTPFSLVRAIALALARPILLGVIPRLLYGALNFSQPFLINAIINAVSDPSLSNNIAGGLIGATVLIYLGVAISRAWYTHITFRFITLLRGSLVSLVLQKCLRLPVGSSGSASAVTHMSTDIQGIAMALEQFHDTWASLVELGVGVFMLSRFVHGATFLIVIPTIGLFIKTMDVV